MSRRRFRFIKSEQAKLGNPFRFQVATAHSAFFTTLVFLGLLSLLTLLWWLFFSPNFAIGAVRVDGTLAIPPDQLQELVSKQLNSWRWKIVSQRNIFALDTRKLSQAISDQFITDQIYIKKIRPHTLTITISEKPREAIWSSRNRYFALDTQGTLVGEVNFNAQLNTKPVIYDQSGAEVTIGTQVLAPATLAFMAQLIQTQSILKLDPRFFVVEKPQATELTIKTKAGWGIRLDSAAPAHDQLQNLELTLRHSIPPDKRSQLDYIDLRFGERVYFKSQLLP